MNLSYDEGTWFAVPLRRNGFAVGVVARTSSTGKIVLCYFFGPSRSSIPTLSDLNKLNPPEAVRIVRAGDLSLINGHWPIIGKSAEWNRDAWKMPPFVRRDELANLAWRVLYSDQDSNSIDHEEGEPYESKLERDAVLGAGAVEGVLTKLLCVGNR